MRGGAFIALLLGAMLAPVSLLADGCFIPATAFAKVEIPDQRALIHYADGTETLVIDTAFKGQGTNFAWIVPVPSKPEIEPATTGLFTTLQLIFQPNIVHDVPTSFWLIAGPCLFISSLIWQARRGGSLLNVLLIWLSLFLFAGLLLPAMGSASASATSSAGLVNVLERKVIGSYETVTLSSNDGSALTDWLNANGFGARSNFFPAIKAYSAEGWCFVASRIRLDVPMSEARRPHPLLFRFKTAKPVYPLRLTGIGNDNCSIELYVFGEGRAEAMNFSVERCETPTYPPESPGKGYSRLNELRIRHPLLRKLVDKSPVATKLTAQLSSAQMNEDAYFSWSEFRQKRLTLYSQHGASGVALNVAVSLFVASVTLLYAVSGRTGAWAKRIRVTSYFAAVAAAVLWPAVYLSLPKTEVIASHMPGIRNIMYHQETPLMLNEAYDQAIKSGSQFKPDVGWVRRQLSENSDIKDFVRGGSWRTNLFTGSLKREEDSPGNYNIRATEDGINYVWYDIDGAETVVPLFQEKQP